MRWLFLLLPPLVFGCAVITGISDYDEVPCVDCTKSDAVVDTKPGDASDTGGDARTDG
jgi:hypothetical protein